MSSGDQSFAADLAAPPVAQRLRGKLPLPLLGTVLVLFGSGAMLFLVNPAESRWYPFCLFHQATGLLCPGCGCLRATHQLMHGNIAAAFHLNQLFVFSLPLFAWLAVRLALRRFQRKPLLTAVHPAWIWAGFFVLLAFGVLRNLQNLPGI